MTKEEQEVSWLRAAFAQPDGAPAPDECPPPERLWAAAAGELSPQEVRSVVEHLGACAACAEEWRLAVELGAGGTATSRAPAAAPPRWRIWLPRAAAVAVVALGIAVFQLRDAPKAKPPVMRGESAAVQPRVEDGSTLARERFLLRWTAAPSARTYTIVVQEPGGRVLFRHEGLTAPEAEVPASAFAGLGAFDLVYWQVITSYSDGTRISSLTWKVRLR